MASVSSDEPPLKVRKTGHITSHYFTDVKADSIIQVRFGKKEPDEEGKIARFAVAYWSIRGLGAPLRMMLFAARMNHDVHMYDSTETGVDGNFQRLCYQTEKPKIIANYQTPLLNLPHIADRKLCVVVNQSNACMSYLGRALGLWGRDDIEVSQCEELLSEIYDLRCAMVQFAYRSDATASAAERLVSDCQKYFLKLEEHLKVESTKSSVDKPRHLVGSRLMAPDFHLFEMLDQFEGLRKEYDLGDVWAKYPYLAAFKKGFEELPENKAYLNSWLHDKLPFNSCMAKFGSDLDAKVYQYGKTKGEWRNRGTEEMRFEN